MKYLFIINPVAGKGREPEDLIEKIKKTSQELKVECDVYVTEGYRDAEKYTASYLKGIEEGETVRIISMGGDGTLNEVINGSVFFFESHNVQIGSMPLGSGNDFIRNFKDGYFKNIARQLTGETEKVDIIAYEYERAGNIKKRYCANMLNIGFDCEVVVTMSTLKDKPFLRGSGLYLASVFITLARKNTIGLFIELDGIDTYTGEVLLAAVGNGCYCGGGIKAAPRASMTDGKLDVGVAINMPTPALLKLFPKYIKGTHLEDKQGKKVVTYYQAKEVKVSSKGEEINVCIDGEPEKFKEFAMRVEPLKMNFVVPKK
ncbi:MAG: diacylglycerol kinase family protein [Anaerovoracaceae bacterium]